MCWSLSESWKNHNYVKTSCFIFKFQSRVRSSSIVYDVVLFPICFTLYKTVARWEFDTKSDHWLRYTKTFTLFLRHTNTNKCMKKKRNTYIITYLSIVLMLISSLIRQLTQYYQLMSRKEIRKVMSTVQKICTDLFVW
jgi:hypothetical protein